MVESKTKFTILTFGILFTDVAKGLVQKSTRTIFEVADQFIAKVPGYKNTIEFAGESLVLFEIRFDTAIVTKDLKTIQTIEL